MQYKFRQRIKIQSLKQGHALDFTKKDTVSMDLIAVLSMKVFKLSIIILNNFKRVKHLRICK